MLENIHTGRERGQVISEHFEHLFQLCGQNQDHSQTASQKADRLFKAGVLCTVSSIDTSVTVVQEVVGNGGILLLLFLSLMHLSLSIILVELYLQLKLS